MVREIAIRGLKVRFPFDNPYPSQRALMSQVILALKDAKNALLESPTGTGKSAALISAALCWAQTFKSSEDTVGDSLDFIPVDQEPEPESDEKDQKKKPTVFYLTRTHSQITQLISEVRSTEYEPVVAILGSREQYCVEMRARNSRDLNATCREIVDRNECMYYRGVKDFERKYCRGNNGGSKYNKAGTWDIEDFKKVCGKDQACPYFCARSLAGVAELIFAPYQYVLDPMVSKAMEVNMAGSVLIFDEAHNIENVVRDACSMDLSFSRINAVSAALTSVANSKDRDLSFVDPLSVIADALCMYTDEIGKGSPLTVPLTGKQMLSRVKALMRQPGDLAKPDVVATYLLHVKDAFAACLGSGEQGNKYKRKKNQVPPHLHALLGALPTLEKVLYLISLMASSDTDCYRIVGSIIEVQQSGGKGRGGPDAWRKRQRQELDDEEEQAPTESELGIWLMDPAIGFRVHSARSVLLVSGTLAPFSSFESELGMQFPVRLTAPHVINTRRQLVVSCVGKFRQGREIRAVYQNVSSPEFQNDLVTAILEYAKVVPHGMLVFFPSYRVLELTQRLVEAKTGAGPALRKVKKFFSERKSRSGGFVALLKKYRQAAAKPHGALLFAVCRGRASEGMDFLDNFCRMSLIVGIPYPSFKDEKVRLKRQFNDDRLRQHDCVSGAITGSEWYDLQAFRAVNQAVGRVIRHRYDYGSVVFLDMRYNDQRNRPKITAWLERSAVADMNVMTSVGRIERFFKGDFSRESLDENDRTGSKLLGAAAKPDSSAGTETVVRAAGDRIQQAAQFLQARGSGAGARSQAQAVRALSTAGPAGGVPSMLSSDRARRAALDAIGSLAAKATHQAGGSGAPVAPPAPGAGPVAGTSPPSRDRPHAAPAAAAGTAGDGPFVNATIYGIPATRASFFPPQSTRRSAADTQSTAPSAPLVRSLARAGAVSYPPRVRVPAVPAKRSVSNWFQQPAAQAPPAGRPVSVRAPTGVFYGNNDKRCHPLTFVHAKGRDGQPYGEKHADYGNEHVQVYRDHQGRRQNITVKGYEYYDCRSRRILQLPVAVLHYDMEAFGTSTWFADFLKTADRESPLDVFYTQVVAFPNGEVVAIAAYRKCIEFAWAPEEVSSLRPEGPAGAHWIPGAKQPDTAHRDISGATGAKVASSDVMAVDALGRCSECSRLRRTLETFLLEEQGCERGELAFCLRFASTHPDEPMRSPFYLVRHPDGVSGSKKASLGGESFSTSMSRFGLEGRVDPRRLDKLLKSVGREFNLHGTVWDPSCELGYRMVKCSQCSQAFAVVIVAVGWHMKRLLGSIVMISAQKVIAPPTEASAREPWYGTAASGAAVGPSSADTGNCAGARARSKAGAVARSSYLQNRPTVEGSRRGRTISPSGRKLTLESASPAAASTPSPQGPCGPDSSSAAAAATPSPGERIPAAVARLRKPDDLFSEEDGVPIRQRGGAAAVTGPQRKRRLPFVAVNASHGGSPPGPGRPRKRTLRQRVRKV